ncbi:mixed lineage kinase domain-like protein [Ptychodera flava]|uniref:mixed lineage kinase domain-like protein n=1 Tax=Ptychodera flava TaxID=63121 RepID=UPI00396A81F4
MKIPPKLKENQEAITSKDIQIKELKKKNEGEAMKAKCVECEKKDVELKNAHREKKAAEAVCTEQGNIIKELRTRQQENMRNCGETCRAEGPNLQELGEDSLSRKDVTDLTPIAEKGVGSVSRAKYRGKIVAIKDYNSRQSTSEFNRKALYRSHEKMKCYAGRHTVKAVGVVDDKETATCWHVTEYEERGSLRKVLADESTSLTWIKKVDFALGVCQCLLLLHNRDNPEVLGKIGSNKFLLGLNWDVKMCDFACTDNPDWAREYLMNQNRSCMPPEHVTELQMTYNMTTECYWVGVILSEIATRKSATEAKTLPDDCPDEYRKVVNGLMESDPCSRMNVRESGGRDKSETPLREECNSRHDQVVTDRERDWRTERDRERSRERQRQGDREREAERQRDRDSALVINCAGGKEKVVHPVQSNVEKLEKLDVVPDISITKQTNRNRNCVS